MRKIKLLAVALLLSLNTITASAATDTKTPIDINVNGSYIKTDAKPFISSDLTYVPIRFVAEALCADEVNWDSENDTAIIVSENTEITLPIGESYGYINGKSVKISGGIILKDDRTFVPVRFVAESMGATVEWDSENFIVSIYKQGVTVPQSAAYDRGYSNEDIYWLSRIIEAEASGEPFEGKLAVGNVVLNRVNNPNYPETVKEVIFDKNFGIQFEPVANGSIYNEPSYNSIVAAKYALQGWDAVGDSIYFLNTATAASTWIINNRPYYTTVGNHSFYL